MKMTGTAASCGLRFMPPAGLEPVHPRHDRVDQDQVGRDLVRSAPARRSPTSATRTVKPARSSASVRKLSVSGQIVDHQDDVARAGPRSAARHRGRDPRAPRGSGARSSRSDEPAQLRHEGGAAPVASRSISSACASMPRDVADRRQPQQLIEMAGAGPDGGARSGARRGARRDARSSRDAAACRSAPAASRRSNGLARIVVVGRIVAARGGCISWTLADIMTIGAGDGPPPAAPRDLPAGHARHGRCRGGTGRAASPRRELQAGGRRPGREHGEAQRRQQVARIRARWTLSSSATRTVRRAPA